MRQHAVPLQNYLSINYETYLSINKVAQITFIVAAYVQSHDAAAADDF